jgi:hypothetical protein
MSHQVFIAYSSNDLPVASAVCENLENRGVNCWIAPRNITPGTSWANSISLAIRECVIFIIILSKRSADSSQIIRELILADENEKLIIPFLIENLNFTGTFKYILSTRQIFDGTQQPINEAIGKLSKEILIILQQHKELPQTDHISQNISPANFATEQIKPPNTAKKAENYDVFISYRRSTGSQTARVIRSEIQNRGYKVFLDVDDLRPGHFDDSLIRCICDTKNFVIILSEDCLERCSNEDDWLRKEILTAINNKKNIIPILMPGFSFPKPEEFPQELRPLLVHHGINYSHEYFNAMVDKLVGFLD